MIPGTHAEYALDGFVVWLVVRYSVGHEAARSHPTPRHCTETRLKRPPRRYRNIGSTEIAMAISIANCFQLALLTTLIWHYTYSVSNLTQLAVLTSTVVSISAFRECSKGTAVAAALMGHAARSCLIYLIHGATRHHHFTFVSPAELVPAGLD